ncbi:transcriptional regulator [Bacillus paranthracis]|nr:transcriptional regulator [Bacillus paranthracis]
MNKIIHFNVEHAQELGLTQAVILEYINDIAFLEEKKLISFDMAELLDELQISLTTVKFALVDLKKAGYIETRRRDGMQFVTIKKEIETADQYFYVKPTDTRWQPKVCLVRTILEDHGGWATNKYMYETSGMFNKDTGNAILNGMVRKGILERRRDSERSGVGKGNGKQIRYRYIKQEGDQ